MKNNKKFLFKILKIGISLVLLYLVFKKVPFTSIYKVVKNVNLFYLLLAIGSLLISQIISSNRLLLFFDKLTFNISAKSNLQLYFVGMFYNFFIPGGIGGDAYKIYLLNKHFKWSVKKLTKAVFVDRLIGLVAILIWILLLVLILPTNKPFFFYLLIPLAIIGGFIISKISIKKFFSIFNTIFYKTITLSFIIQAFQLISILLIIKALHINQHYTTYLILFLISSVLSIISFAGIGVREYIFLKASLFLNFNLEASVAIGLLFTLISFLIALTGVYFEITNPKLTITKRQ